MMEKSPHPLNYRAPSPSLRLLVPQMSGVCIGTIIGAFVTFPAIVLAVVLSGVEYGEFGVARALFPVPMLLTLLTHNEIGLPSFVLVVMQFSIYGGLIGGSGGRRWLFVLLAILVLHLAGVFACFAAIVPQPYKQRLHSVLFPSYAETCGLSPLSSTPPRFRR